MQKQRGPDVFPAAGRRMVAGYRSYQHVSFSLSGFGAGGPPWSCDPADRPLLLCYPTIGCITAILGQIRLPP